MSIRKKKTYQVLHFPCLIPLCSSAAPVTSCILQCILKVNKFKLFQNKDKFCLFTVVHFYHCSNGAFPSLIAHHTTTLQNQSSMYLGCLHDRLELHSWKLEHTKVFFTKEEKIGASKFPIYLGFSRLTFYRHKQHSSDIVNHLST